MKIKLNRLKVLFFGMYLLVLCQAVQANNPLEGKSINELQKLVKIREALLKTANSNFNANAESLRKREQRETKFKKSPADIKKIHDLAAAKRKASAAYHDVLDALDSARGMSPGFSR